MIRTILLVLVSVLAMFGPAFAQSQKMFAAAQKPITDDILIDQVRVKLASDADVGGMPIQVDVHQGAVTLKGKVRTDKQRSKAEKIAKKVKGVTSVTNQLVVSPD